MRAAQHRATTVKAGDAQRATRTPGHGTHVAVAVRQALLDGRHERLQELGLTQLAEEAQRRSAHILVGVLQVL